MVGSGIVSLPTIDGKEVKKVAEVLGDWKLRGTSDPFKVTLGPGCDEY